MGHPIIFSQFRLSSRALPLPYPVLGLLLEGSSTHTVPANNTKHLESFSTFFLPQSPSAWFWKPYSIERFRRCHRSSATRTWGASQKATSSGWPTLTHLAAHGYTVPNASSLPTTHCPLPLLCFAQKDGALVGFLDGMYVPWGGWPTRRPTQCRFGPIHFMGRRDPCKEATAGSQTYRQANQRLFSYYGIVADTAARRTCCRSSGKCRSWMPKIVASRKQSTSLASLCAGHGPTHCTVANTRWWCFSDLGQSQLDIGSRLSGQKYRPGTSPAEASERRSGP
jgi:hypothetical protein